MYNLRSGSAAPSVPSHGPQSEETHDSAADASVSLSQPHSVTSGNIFRGHQDSGQSGECVRFRIIACRKHNGQRRHRSSGNKPSNRTSSKPPPFKCRIKGSSTTIDTVRRWPTCRVNLRQTKQFTVYTQ